jgi:predicted transcriptional regulator
MRPIDYRNETWEDVRNRVDALRGIVFAALEMHGPCTTRELSIRARMDILTVRPRVTELCQLGLAELANPESGGHEGIYRAVSMTVARMRFEQLKADAQPEKQLNLL